MTTEQQPTGRLVLRYLMQRGEPAIVQDIANAIGASHSATRCAILRSAGYTFVEAGSASSASGKGRRSILWVAWEE